MFCGVQNPQLKLNVWDMANQQREQGVKNVLSWCYVWYGCLWQIFSSLFKIRISVQLALVRGSQNKLVNLLLTNDNCEDVHIILVFLGHVDHDNFLRMIKEQVKFNHGSSNQSNSVLLRLCPVCGPQRVIIQFCSLNSFIANLDEHQDGSCKGHHKWGMG